ncbi:hypothetical protein [Kribbella sp. NPDC050470]|uniref:hypothetical protein n=1 Tax=unclassified Kribbella TaxID=2644121 RepID=UPI00379944D2
MGESELRGARREPDDVDLERWRVRQRRLAEVYAQGQVALDEGLELRPITRDLAELLWSFRDDRRLWRQLRKQQIVVEDLDEARRVQLRAAVDIDWAPFLREAGHQPPPSAEVLADEFRMDVRRAIGDGGVYTRDLRARVADLATRLDRALADQRPGAGARIRSYLRLTLPVAGRAAVVHGVAAAAGFGAGAALAPTLGPFGAAVGLAVVSGATREALGRVLPQWEADTRGADGPTRSEVIRTVIERLRPEEAGAQAENLHALGALSRQHPPGTSMLRVATEAGAEELFRAALEWIDRTLAAVFVAWQYAATSDTFAAEPSFTQQLECLADDLGRARRALADFGVEGSSLEALADELTEHVHTVLSQLPPGHGKQV